MVILLNTGNKFDLKNALRVYNIILMLYNILKKLKTIIIMLFRPSVR